MPDKATLERAKKDKREGKAPSTQAGEFVREEIEHIREGKHGARSAKQAIAIGLSKARHAGVDLPPPAKGTTSERTRRSAASAYKAGQAHDDKVSPAARARRDACSSAKAQPRPQKRRSRGMHTRRQKRKPHLNDRLRPAKL